VVAAAYSISGPQVGIAFSDFLELTEESCVSLVAAAVYEVHFVGQAPFVCVPYHAHERGYADAAGQKYHVFVLVFVENETAERAAHQDFVARFQTFESAGVAAVHADAELQLLLLVRRGSYRKTARRSRTLPVVQAYGRVLSRQMEHGPKLILGNESYEPHSRRYKLGFKYLVFEFRHLNY
jgi:hypothetical protein